MSRFARDMNVIYWEEPVDIGRRETAYLQVRQAEDCPNVGSSFRIFPKAFRKERARRP